MELRKIDLVKLQDYAFTPDEIAMSSMCSWDKFINIKCLENESIIPTIQAIPLDKVKQTLEKLDKIEQIINSEVDPNICNNIGDVRKVQAIKEVLESEE